MKCYLNPDLFLEFTEHKCVITNYRTKISFELTQRHLKRLVQINKSGVFKDDSLDRELMEGGLISLKPYKDVGDTWEWDTASKIFNYTIKDVDSYPPAYRNMEDLAACWIDNAVTTWNDKIPDILPPRVKKLPKVKLPPSQHKKLPSWPGLAKRKTSRSFKGKEISLSQLSTLLYTAFGKQPNMPDELKAEPINFERTLRFRRTSPSGGGIQTTTPYVVALRVKGLEPGLYFYDSLEHELRLIKTLKSLPGGRLPLGKMLSGQYFADDLSAGVFMTSRFDRISFKYPNSRAYKVLLIDMGHISQTFLLAATEMGLQTWLTGALCESPIEKVLNIDTRHEQVMFFVGVGKGDNNAWHPAQQKLLKEFKAGHRAS